MKVVFVKSSTALAQLPPATLPEVAFVGRSNVGKSSLINGLTGQKIARVSGQPGKTREINHFRVSEAWYLVDLPGYGYAKVSKDQRQEFQQMMLDYAVKRTSRKCVMVLIDARLTPQKIDQEFIEFLGSKSVPFAIAFTKADKIGPVQLAVTVDAWKVILDELFIFPPEMHVTSAEKKRGLPELNAWLLELINGERVVEPCPMRA